MRTRSFLSAAGTIVAGVVVIVACGSNGSREEFPGAENTTGTPAAPPGDPGSLPPDKAKPKCDGLECQQVVCDDPNVTTTVTGIVNAPNGTLPLYNAIVYVPNAPLDPMPEGASCDHCGNVSGKPLVSAVTNVQGKFILANVPVGTNIPLVVQVGKWRRQVTIPEVKKCVENPISDTNATRLPKNSTEGHIPKIAVTTGRCDQLACLLPKLGLDPSEYSLPSGTGRLNLYRGAADPPSKPIAAPAPTGSPDAPSLWSDPSALKKYDMLMLSCECGEHTETKSDAAKAALYDFASAGGRVFASHFHYIWTSQLALAGTAQWMGSASNAENPIGPFLVDQTFPKGAAFAQWLVGVGASSKLGEIPISQARADVGAVNAPNQRWVYRKRWAVDNVIPDPVIPEAAMYVNVNTPVGKPADQQCGKFVFADMHLYGGDRQPDTGALPDDAFPASCSTTLTPEEKALAFLFFDLSSCVQDDTKPPQAPVK